MKRTCLVKIQGYSAYGIETFFYKCVENHSKFNGFFLACELLALERGEGEETGIQYSTCAFWNINTELLFFLHM